MLRQSQWPQTSEWMGRPETKSPVHPIGSLPNYTNSGFANDMQAEPIVSWKAFIVASQCNLHTIQLLRLSVACVPVSPVGNMCTQRGWKSHTHSRRVGSRESWYLSLFRCAMFWLSISSISCANQLTCKPQSRPTMLGSMVLKESTNAYACTARRSRNAIHHQAMPRR